VLAVTVTIVILWQLRRLGSRSWALFFALLLGGVVGNLTDRLTRPPGFPVGEVVDFILTPWMWLGFSPAIYNIADMAIVSAMALFLILTLRGVPLSGGPRHRRRAPAEADADVAEGTEAESAEADVAEAEGAAGAADNTDSAADPLQDETP
jgi:signal peptidase II